MKKVVERERNKNYYRVLHVPIWIWCFWILPGHLTASLYAHGPDRRHWIWLAIVTAVCAWRGYAGRLPGAEPRPYITHYGEDKPNLWYRVISYTTAWIALLVQATITSVILLASLSGSTIHEAYVVLLDMTAIMSLLPLLYIFASLPVLRRRAAGRDKGITLVPGGRIACWVWAALGFVTTAFAVVTSAVPPDAGRSMLFLVKVVGGCTLLIGVGMAFYINGSRRR